MWCTIQAEEEERIRKRHQFDIYVVQLDELQIAFGMWNSLTRSFYIQMNDSIENEGPSMILQ